MVCLKKLKEFDTSQRLAGNHRSLGKIISILNMIYNDNFYKQDSDEDNKDGIPDISPQVSITSNVSASLSLIGVPHF